MSSLDQLKQTFFDECSEALQQIELGLPDIRDGSGSEDTINAVFRGVHSVKGGAGIFGFEDLVKFAHVFETVLDEMRSGRLAATQEIVDTLLQANDVLTDLISMSRSSESIPPDFGSECRAALQQILHANSGGEPIDDGEAAPADFEGIDFVLRFRSISTRCLPRRAVRGRCFGQRRARISDRVPAETGIAEKGQRAALHHPRIEEARYARSGRRTDRLPPLPKLEADRPYLGWTGTLRTPATREKIDDVFEFVVGDCELEITRSRCRCWRRSVAGTAAEASSAWEGMVGSVVPPDVVADKPSCECLAERHPHAWSAEAASSAHAAPAKPAPAPIASPAAR